jgi:hypothetical protein
MILEDGEVENDYQSEEKKKVISSNFNQNIDDCWGDGGMYDFLLFLILFIIIMKWNK